MDSLLIVLGNLLGHDIDLEYETRKKAHRLEDRIFVHGLAMYQLENLVESRFLEANRKLDFHSQANPILL